VPGVQAKPQEAANDVSQEVVFQGDSMVGKLEAASGMAAFRALHGNVEVTTAGYPLMRRDCWLLTTCVRRCAMGRSLRWTQLGLNSGSARVSTCGPSATTTLSRKHGLAGLSLCFGECVPILAIVVVLLIARHAQVCPKPSCRVRRDQSHTCPEDSTAHPAAIYGLEQEGRLAAQNTRDGAVDWAAVKTRFHCGC